jgi:hypothetical protein
MIAAIPFNQIEDLTAKFLNFWLDGWFNLKAEVRRQNAEGDAKHRNNHQRAKDE